MKVVVLAGGYGTRLSEETTRIPKPLVEVGGWPILWHIMKIYGAHDLRDFILCLGYKGYLIKEYFANFYLHRSDVTFDLGSGASTYHNSISEPWRVTLADTGEGTLTGGRIKRVGRYIGGQTFCMTYGDGVGDIDIKALIAFHRSHGKLATVTAIRQPGRFGVLDLDGQAITAVREKPTGDDNWINGGFFVLEPGVLDYIGGDQTTWERDPMDRLAADGQLMAFRHEGFWQPMDTLRERNMLEELWASGRAPWKIWA
jgi:glucose-1-phosphate cytidylyltransferase